MDFRVDTTKRAATRARFAAIAEHCNAIVVREKILPLLQAAAKE